MNSRFFNPNAFSADVVTNYKLLEECTYSWILCERKAKEVLSKSHRRM
jgi:hypothetical protein